MGGDNLLIIKHIHNRCKSIYSNIDNYIDYVHFCISECNEYNPIIKRTALTDNDTEGDYLIIMNNIIRLVNKKSIISKGVVYSTTDYIVDDIITYKLFNCEYTDTLEDITDINIHLQYDTLLRLYIKNGLKLDMITRWVYPNHEFIMHFRRSLTSINSIKIRKDSELILKYFTKLKSLELVGAYSKYGLRDINSDLKVDEIIFNNCYSLPYIQMFSPKKLIFIDRPHLMIMSERKGMLQNIEGITELTINEKYRSYIEQLENLKDTFIIYTK